MSSEYGWDAPPRGRGGNDRPDGERLADARADDAYGYGSDGYGGQDGYDGYANGGGYSGNGYAENGQYADQEYSGYGGNGQDSYGSRDAYSTGEVYGAPDGYGGADPRTSGPYNTGAGGYAGGYGSDAGYGGQDGYGQNSFGGQDPYGSQPGAGYERGGGYNEQDYGWRDSRPHEAVDDPGLTRRRSAAQDDFDADDARHDGFFRGFGGGDDDFAGNRRRGGGGGGGGGRGRRPAKQRGSSKAGLVALTIVVIVFAGIAGVGYHYYSAYKARHATFSGSGYGPKVTILVKSGDTFDTIAPQLLHKGVIAAIDPWATYVQNKQGLQPGQYKINIHMSLAATYLALTNPKNLLVTKYTIPDGMRLTKILQSLATQSGHPLSQFEAAANDIAALGLPPYADGKLEGFLYPDTYDLAPGETPLQILQAMVAQFKKEVAPLHLQAAAAAVGYNARAVIIGASLLEAEVGPQYFGDVARVIDNRLNSSPPMDLGLDTTLAYALNKPASKLTTSDFNSTSPWNTRNHAGMPPGPIDSPDLQAIEAFLHPPHNGNLYFVTVDKKGTTDFTASFAQFQADEAICRQNGLC